MSMTTMGDFQKVIKSMKATFSNVWVFTLSNQFDLESINYSNMEASRLHDLMWRFAAARQAQNDSSSDDDQPDPDRALSGTSSAVYSTKQYWERRYTEEAQEKRPGQDEW